MIGDFLISRPTEYIAKPLPTTGDASVRVHYDTDNVPFIGSGPELYVKSLQEGINALMLLDFVKFGNVMIPANVLDHVLVVRPLHEHKRPMRHIT